MDDNSPPTTLQKELSEELSRIVDEILTLRVTTIVGSAHAEPNSAAAVGSLTAVALDGNGEQKVFSTSINMALGDLTQIMHPDFEANPVLVKLHQDAIATARAIRAETVGIVTALAKDLAARS